MSLAKSMSSDLTSSESNALERATRLCVGLWEKAEEDLILNCHRDEYDAAANDEDEAEDAIGLHGVGP